MSNIPEIQLRQVRTMRITPQLRQAINLLQFNNRALAAFIAIHAASNPYLQILTAGDSPSPSSGFDVGPAKNGAEPPRDVPSGVAGRPSGESDWQETAQSIVAPTAGLYEHVRRQIDLSISDPRQKGIAYLFAEALEPSGWLGRSVEKIAREAACSVDEAEAVLTALQGFEPTGLFARSLAECLRLQAVEAGILTDILALVLDNLETVGRGEIDRLAKLGKTSGDVIMAQVKVIRHLNPKPGAAFEGAPTAALPPDLVVRRVDGDWQVELNRSNLPAITVCEIKPDQRDAASSEQKARLLAEARWLERAVARRNVTTLTIAAEVVRRQTWFLTHGPSKHVPMSIADIAGAIGVHESTVSRVTTGLMITTPRGTVSLRDFFSVRLPGELGGGGVSATAVRDEIRRMINDEDAETPVSDEAIAAHFKRRRISIARRTVAKYREMLGIPGSAKRKQRARLSKP